jgi:hypothetical protein
LEPSSVQISPAEQALILNSGALDLTKVHDRLFSESQNVHALVAMLAKIRSMRRNRVRLAELPSVDDAKVKLAAATEALNAASVETMLPAEYQKLRDDRQAAEQQVIEIETLLAGIIREAPSFLGDRANHECRTAEHLELKALRRELAPLQNELDPAKNEKRQSHRVRFEIGQLDGFVKTHMPEAATIPETLGQKRTFDDVKFAAACDRLRTETVPKMEARIRQLETIVEQQRKDAQKAILDWVDGTSWEEFETLLGRSAD